MSKKRDKSNINKTYLTMNMEYNAIKGKLYPKSWGEVIKDE